MTVSYECVGLIQTSSSDRVADSALKASPTRAYTAVMTAAKPDDVSTTDELLGIGKQAAEDRRFALMAHQRWESDGGALRRRRHQPGGSAATAEGQEVRNAQ